MVRLRFKTVQEINQPDIIQIKAKSACPLTMYHLDLYRGWKFRSVWSLNRAIALPFLMCLIEAINGCAVRKCINSTRQF